MIDPGRTHHTKAAIVSGRPAPHIPPRHSKAHRVKNDQEAIEIAKELAATFAAKAMERDANRLLPIEEVEIFSQSGLWGITVPKEFGGADVSRVTLAEVTAIISAADSSLGQIPQNHYYMVEALRIAGSEQQKQHYFERVLDGDRLGNAFTEIGTKTAVDFKTKLTSVSDQKFLVNGQKFYSTGSLFAHIIVAVASKEDGKTALVFIERSSPGLSLIDDWSSFGQKTTGSGSVLFDNVEVTPFQVADHQETVFEQPSPMGPFAQIIHAAVEVGIARGALDAAISYVRKYARPFFELTIEHGYEDPHLIHSLGDVALRVNAANAMLARAGTFVDTATGNPTDKTVAAASIAVAEGARRKFQDRVQ